MIVIATNNGKQFLEKLIPALEKWGTGGHKVAFIDTGSTDGSWDYLVEHVRRLHTSRYPEQGEWILDKTPFKGYDTGAYIYAYRKYPEETYLFMHDSCRPDGFDWVKRFEEKMDPYALTSGSVGAVGITVYEGLFCHPDQPVWLDSVMPFKCAEVNAPLGVGGPIFYTSKNVLDQAEAFGCFKHFPSKKIEQMAMEGGWGMIMHYLGYRVVSATGYQYVSGTQNIQIVNDNLRGFMVKDEPQRT